MASKSKKVVVEDDLDDEIDQVEEPVMTEKVSQPKQKVKRERTPAQKEAFSKALAILKEKREAKAKEEKERYEKATQEEKERIKKEKYEKAKNHKKKLPPAPSYVTTGDLEKFKLDILNAIPKYEKPEPVKEPKPEPVKIDNKPEPIIVPKKKAEPIVQKPLTGHDLLDKLFFS